jgi:hypothetical protein
MVHPLWGIDDADRAARDVPRKGKEALVGIGCAVKERVETQVTPLQELQGLVAVVV